jgi:WD40 repeat protein
VAELFISSTRQDRKPSYSPDGKKIAFTSSRSGTSEIWVSKADGSNPVRMTSFNQPLVGYANWSPDGQWLVFHARPEGQADVFVIPAAGGVPKRLTTDTADDAMASYSHDGRWIYFSSARSGQAQVWRMPAAGGDALQLTTSGGLMPIESKDGKTVFYVAPDGSGIRRVPFSGGESVPVVGPIHGYPSGFAVTAEGIFYPAPPHSGNQRFIRFFSFSTGEGRPIAVASHAFHIGMSVSPDSKYVLFDQFDELGSDLMLIENFHLR